MVDALFADPRLAEVYDALDGSRDDLAAYLAVVDEVGAGSVLDIGCGTGTFACLLARRGIDVTGLDPAPASIAVARRKPGADRVRWIEGDTTILPSLTVDVVTMTGNVAQVFLTDDVWTATLDAARRSLHAGGTLAFETRDPRREGWREWTPERTRTRTDDVEAWAELTDVDLPFVSFRWTFRFVTTGDVVTSDSTLRFRTEDEVTASLRAAGFVTIDVRDAPDRPGRELVFVATRR